MRTEPENVPSTEHLIARIGELESKVRSLETENRDLRDRLQEAERKSARQAAPFRRRDSKKVLEENKKRPGRPKGHPGSHREVPQQIDEHLTVELSGCPECGGAVTGVEEIEQFIEEIPVIRPRVTRVVTYRGHCLECGDVQSTHPLQTSTATGAAKVQLGPNARAWAITLNKQFGLTTRKTCRVLKGLVGLSLSPGGLTQAASRAAEKLQPSYDQLIDEVRDAKSVFADETSWYVGGPGHWLWTFTTHDATVYHVDKSRGRQVVLELLGPDFAGILVSDCLSSYESLPYRTHKCIAHHQKAIAEARARPDTPDPRHLDEWKLLFTMVITLWRHRSKLGEEEFTRQRGCLEEWLDRLLWEVRPQPGDRAIQQRIGKRRDSVLGCLYDPAAEPTNNRAERALRDVGVIARKLSCGNKTTRGKEAWERLTSLAVTCQQRGHDFAAWLSSSLPLTASITPLPDAR
jgi:transposase